MRRYLVFFFATLLGCSFSNGPSPSKKELRTPLVLVSLPPYQTMVEQIAGESVRVACVVPSQVDPHGWEPTYKDLSNFNGAKIWFTIGEEFEPKLIAKLKEVNPGIEIVDLADALKSETIFLEPGSNTPDSHFWLDPIRDILQVNAMRSALTELLPEHKILYENRFFAIRDTLSILQLALADKLNSFKGDLIVTTHGAYTYFCNRYGIEQIVVEPSEGKEPKTKDIARMVEKLERKKSQIRGVFLQPGHSNKASEIIAKQLSLPIYEIDPYELDYVTTMQALADAITHN